LKSEFLSPPGKIVERYSYDVFGQPEIRNANNQILTTGFYGNPYMFTGSSIAFPKTSFSSEKAAMQPKTDK
jgi:hypothetical protein